MESSAKLGATATTHTHQKAKKETKMSDFDKEKAITLVVNAQEKPWAEKFVSYDQALHLAFETPLTGENILTTITYRRGHSDQKQGSLTPGDSVRAKDRMRFDVTQTDRS
jgi:Multiubiquitin